MQRLIYVNEFRLISSSISLTMFFSLWVVKKSKFRNESFLLQKNIISDFQIFAITENHIFDVCVETTIQKVSNEKDKF